MRWAVSCAPEGVLASGRYRGLSLDAGRRAFTPDAVIRLLERMAQLGLTALHLHLSETHRLGIVLPGFEHLAAADAWDARDAARIRDAARDLAVAIVPEIDLPSHAAALLADRPDLRLRDAAGRVHEDRLDISRPEAGDLARRILDAVAEMLPGQALHLGGDEFFAAPWEDEEARDPERFPSLVRSARAAAGPDASALDAYALFVNDLAAHARSLGRTPILWNDHVVPRRERPLVPVDPGIVLEVWIRWRAWTPSVTDYLADGFRVINAHGDRLYAVLSAEGPFAPHGLRAAGLLADTFSPRRFMGLAAHGTEADIVVPAPADGPDPVLGAEMSLWCDAPDLLAEDELLALLDTWLVPFAASMRA